jgi:hypothetical protein
MNAFYAQHGGLVDQTSHPPQTDKVSLHLRVYPKLKWVLWWSTKPEIYESLVATVRSLWLVQLVRRCWRYWAEREITRQPETDTRCLARPLKITCVGAWDSWFVKSITVVWQQESTNNNRFQRLGENASHSLPLPLLYCSCVLNLVFVWCAFPRHGRQMGFMLLRALALTKGRAYTMPSVWWFLLCCKMKWFFLLEELSIVSYVLLSFLNNCCCWLLSYIYTLILFKKLKISYILLLFIFLKASALVSIYRFKKREF